MGFRFKCHEIGEAIKVTDTIVTFCKCITDKEVMELVKQAKVQALKEAKNADV